MIDSYNELRSRARLRPAPSQSRIFCLFRRFGVDCVRKRYKIDTPDDLDQRFKAKAMTFKTLHQKYASSRIYANDNSNEYGSKLGRLVTNRFRSFFFFWSSKKTTYTLPERISGPSKNKKNSFGPNLSS